jgi:hypothetical protein
MNTNNIYFAQVIIIFTIAISTFPVSAKEDKIPNQIQKPTNPFTTHRCDLSPQIPLSSSYKRIKLKQGWCGQVPKELRALAPSSGYIDRELDWVKLWKAYRGDEGIPKIDFKRELIVLYVHSDSNNVNMTPVLYENGSLVVESAFTEQGTQDNLSTYFFASIDRQGIKTINGKPIVNKPIKDSGF